MDAAQQNVWYRNTVTLGDVRTVVILGVPGAGQRAKSSDVTNCPCVSKDQ